MNLPKASDNGSATRTPPSRDSLLTGDGSGKDGRGGLGACVLKQSVRPQNDRMLTGFGFRAFLLGGGGVFQGGGASGPLTSKHYNTQSNRCGTAPPEPSTPQLGPQPQIGP